MFIGSHSLDFRFAIDLGKVSANLVEHVAPALPLLTLLVEWFKFFLISCVLQNVPTWLDSPKSSQKFLDSITIHLSVLIIPNNMLPGVSNHP